MDSKSSFLLAVRFRRSFLLVAQKDFKEILGMSIGRERVKFESHAGYDEIVCRIANEANHCYSDDRKGEREISVAYKQIVSLGDNVVFVI
jgi:hypothetical protein